MAGALFVLRSYRLALVGLLCVALPVPGGAATWNIPEFNSVAWLPSTASAVARAGFAESGINLESGRHRTGDTTTLLAQIADRGQLRQWAVALSLGGAADRDQKRRSPARTIHLSNGSKVEFGHSSYEAMLNRVLGPFSKSRGAARAKDHRSEAYVNSEYLSLGLHGTVRLWRRLIAESRTNPAVENPFSLHISSNPFPAETVAEHRVSLAPFAITAMEERAYAGFIPAIMDFFRVASQTPGVREIIFDIADIPWWAILKKGGRISDTWFEIIGPFEIVPSRDWGLPDNVTVYSIGLVLLLQQHPTLVCRLALTEPRPPLLNTAGIVGIAATRPDGEGPRLMIKVMAGDPGERVRSAEPLTSDQANNVRSTSQ